jgi:hypothetical protein
MEAVGIEHSTAFAIIGKLRKFFDQRISWGTDGERLSIICPDQYPI